MAVMTLAEFIKRTRDELIAGVAEEILTTNPIWGVMPWTGYAGSGMTVNKETALGDADFYGLGAEITARATSQVTPLLFRSTRCIGDAELDGLQTVESKSDINDLMAMEIASKAKSVGRKMQQGMATGDGSDPHMNSFHSMVDSGQYVTGGSGDIFDYLDAATQKVLTKDGMIDFFMVHGRDALKIRTAYRKLGGVPMAEVRVGNRTFKVMEFNGIPIFTNNWLSITETSAGAALTGGALSSIYCGNFDDGTSKIGVSMIYPEASIAGISVNDIGDKESYDMRVYRVKAYMNFASFNKLGLARITDMPA